MENKPKQQELKIELTPEVAAGHYANLAVISHGPNEFFLDFIAVAPNMPRGQSTEPHHHDPGERQNPPVGTERKCTALRSHIRHYRAQNAQKRPH